MLALISSTAALFSPALAVLQSKIGRRIALALVALVLAFGTFKYVEHLGVVKEHHVIELQNQKADEKAKSIRAAHEKHCAIKPTPGDCLHDKFTRKPVKRVPSVPAHKGEPERYEIY